ncbi:hypothetical protein GGI12_001035 [Dipsacomyces acuminosporus]|nr:hypothetical protein GGI12_001035 [Dipsacomyces acuminosporus]
MTAPSADRRTRIVPIESALLDDDADKAVSRRPGIAYTQHRVAIPADKRAVFIPKDIAIPEDSVITGVVVSQAGSERHGLDTHLDEYDQRRIIFFDDSGRMTMGPPRLPPPRGKRGLAGAAGSSAEDGAGAFHSDEDIRNQHEHEDDEYNDAVRSDLDSDARNVGSKARFVLGSLPEAIIGAATSQTSVQPDPLSLEALKPKKPRNSFFYFRREYHKTTNANGNKAKAKNISSAAGKVWKEMSEEEKAPYKQYAAEDMERYNSEMKEYKELVKDEKKKSKKREKAAVAGSLASSKLPQPAGTGGIARVISMVPTIHLDVESGSADEQADPGYSDQGVVTVGPVGNLPMDMQSEPLYSSMVNGVDTSAGLSSTVDAATGRETAASSSQPGSLHHDSFYVSLSEPSSIVPIELDAFGNTSRLSLANTARSSNSAPGKRKGKGRDTSSSHSLTGIHPSIPDIEIVDASNSISLKKFAVKRRK